MTKKAINNKTKQTQKKASGPCLNSGAGPVQSEVLRVVGVPASDDTVVKGAGPILNDVLRLLIEASN